MVLTMDAEEETAINLQSNSKFKTIPLTTEDDVAAEIKEWIVSSKTEGNENPKSHENAVEHIESELDRSLSSLEATWTERQYVITLLKLWLEKTLGKAFEYLNNEKNDISKEMSNVLNHLDSLNSFEDIRSTLKAVESPLRHWCDGGCRYLNLILEQKDLFTNTSRFTNIVDCYLKQFKTSCIERVFSQCLNEVVKDETNGGKHEKFIIDLNDFLALVNEDKNVLEKMLQANFHKTYLGDYNNTGQDLVKELVGLFVTSSRNDFLTSLRKEENLQSILEKDLELENITDTDWQDIFHRLVKEISCLLQTDVKQTGPSSTPQWFKRYGKASSLLNDVGWTPKLQVLTKETCKKFLLPETEIVFKEEDGKQIISIKGIAIFVSKMIEQMKQLKREHPDVEEIKIVGLKSVHIDCDLDNETWHGINVAIVTDKLIVDDAISSESAPTLHCWNVSGENAITNQPRGTFRQPGESGGNVRVDCNQIINGQNWTIVSDGGDGGAAYKWTKEEFEKSFPSMLADDGEEAMQTVLTTLQQILPNEKRTKGENIWPGHKSNFLISGSADDGSEITAIFYVGKKEKQTLISIARSHAGQGGYGGDITLERFGNTKVDTTSEIPFTGGDTRRKPLRPIKMGVYEASGSNGNIGNWTGDVAFIHKVARKSSSNNTEGKFYGFEKDQKIEVELNVINKPRGDANLSVKYKEDNENRKRYTKLYIDSFNDLHVKVVDAIKKKAVIRQSLIRHLDQIDERKQLTESIQKMLLDPTRHHSNGISEILTEMENKVHQRHQLMTQRQQQEFDQIDQEQYVKPAIDSSRLFSNPKIIGRRPVWNADEDGVNCFDELQTEDGNDSLLHGLFGQLNSEGKYVCKDTNNFRKRLAKHSRQESQNGTLGTAELEILAEILEIKIYVYEYHGSSSFRYKKTVDPKLVKNNEFFILHESNSRWKRLTPNHNLKFFCKEFIKVEDDQNCNLTYFEQLKSRLNEKAEVITSIEKFNPNNKTPDKLSQILLQTINNLNNDVEKIYQLLPEICLLAEWVDYYNTRNISPLFYLNVVANNEPNEWKFEFLLLNLEERLEKPWEDKNDREKWRKDAHAYLNRHDRALQLFTKIIMKSKESDSGIPLQFNILLRIIEENVDIKDVDIKEPIFEEDDTGQLSPINLLYKHSTQYKEQLKDVLPEQNSTSRETREIIAEMNISDKDEIERIVSESKSKKTEFEEGVELIKETLITKNKKYNKFKIFSKEEKSKPNDRTKKTKPELFLEMMKKASKNNILDDNHICNEIVKFTDDGVCYNYDVTENFLCIFDYAVELIMGFQLRDTQRVAITTLLFYGYFGQSKTLAQVSTGEGKSIIVAGLAIGFALFRTKKKKQIRKNNKVDVITSNDVLALRDSNLPVAQGGLKELYEFFNVTVANNSSKSADERKKAYNMDVVYGQLSNFQRDYLLDEFYNRNMRGGRPMVYAIIDEVDCMLLDRGNNMLYLSHDIPGMEMLESLYVFIWERIHDTSAERIKSEILYDLYGQIAKEDLKNIHAPLEQMESERTAIWEHLTEKKVIDQQGRLLINEVSEITEEKFNYKPTNASIQAKTLNPKMVFYFRTTAERERQIRVPSHLLDFVDRHLDTWLDNARRALELKQDGDYVIDHDRSDTSPDLNPQVIIIDPETGTYQSSSQWDGALHQFLQLKEGCKLTLQSLKAVFISNATYIGKYSNLAGLSGTLGSQSEQKFLEKLYKCDLLTVPTAFPKRFSRKPPKILKTKESWRKAVTEETRQTIKNRSIVIFCRSIRDVNVVYKQLKSAIKELRDNHKRIHRYTRDYEKCEFENFELDVGNVIVATNLAGRGTDIKISKNLEANGGLHICLTYFPDNERVEEQAMGRAARKGEPGSGILILCEDQTDQAEDSGTSEEWGTEKMFVMEEIREWKERQRISRMEKDFNHIEGLEEMFERYIADFSEEKVNEKYKKIEYSRDHRSVQPPTDAVLLKVIHDSALDNWALSLDEKDYDFKCFGLQPGSFTIGVKNSYKEIVQWITPGRKVPFAKHKIAMEMSEKIDKKEATDILNELINLTDNFFYPAAFYYRAFIHLTEMKSKNKQFEEEKIEFIRMLRHTETILKKHIDMQIFFSTTHQSKRKPGQTHSFCDVNGYRKQKENNTIIFLRFQSSIQWLLGRRCSLSDLREASGETPEIIGSVEKHLKSLENLIDNKKERSEELEKHKIRLEKVDEYYSKLIKSKCIACKLNDPGTIPSYGAMVEKSTTSSKKNRSKTIFQIADDYGVSASSLEKILEKVFDEALNEEDIENKLKAEIEMKLGEKNLIPCTRKAFWNKLVAAKALNPSKECIDMDCVLMSEEELESIRTELQTELDRRNAIKLEFGCNSFDPKTNCLNVLYDPTYESQQELGAAKKLMFSKEHVKRILLSEYSRRKKKFEFNKIAQLDVTKLAEVELESFGRLGMDDLDRIDIDQSEQEAIWNQLINQNIINDRGYLVPGYDITEDFSYPDCPAYAEPVMRLVGKKFVAEMVRQQWLKAKDNPNCLKAINLLPRKPYRDMLGDLMAAHVVSDARVSEDFAIDFKKKVDKISEHDEERQCMMKFLKSRQPAYAEKSITTEFVLNVIEPDTKASDFSNELYVFRLVGFDGVIDTKDGKWTFKRILKTSLMAPIIIAGGLASIGGGAALTYCSILSFGLSKNLFLMGGFSDILYAVETILYRKDFTWADYGRQRIRSTMGKMNPIDAIKAIWKLKGSTNQSLKDVTITNEHRWRTPAERNQVQWSTEKKKNTNMEKLKHNETTT